MELFILENNIAKPSIEALLISPFKEIWESDKTKQKGKAINIFTYIELYCSYKRSNPYSGYTELEREETLKELLFHDSKYKLSKLVLSAIARYQELRDKASFYMRFFIAQRTAAEKLIEFYETFEMTEKNQKSGVPLYKPRDITGAIKESSEVLSKMDALEKQIKAEEYSRLKTKGNRQISPLEI
jgi:hypothetical protein